MRRRAVALVLAVASAGTTLATFAGCGGAAASRPPVPPVTTSTKPAPVPSSDAGGAARRASEDGGAAAERPPPPPLPRPPTRPPAPSFGAGSVKPGDAQAFRLVVALRAMRASPSGAKVLQTLSLVPAAMDGRRRTGVDPFSDGEWLLVYGPEVAVPGANANVLRHARPDAEITTAIADAGFEARDGHPAGPVHADLYGVRDVLLRPQPGTLALVPDDRAVDLGAELSRPIDPGVKRGELARIFIADPAKLARVIPDEVARANLIVKPHADGGIDLAADADCGDAASCASTASALDAFVSRQNSVMVRIATRSLLSGVVIRSDGTKLRATVHVSPDQVDAILSLTRALLGLPAPPSP